jgi:hypothetical protein
MIALRVLIDEHRGAFEYDWRTRFHLPLDAIPEAMGWGEVHRMALILAADPTSQVCSAISQWRHPLSWEGIALRDLYDMQHASKSKRKPKPYPRPWDRPATTYGAGTTLTPEQYQAIRDRHIDN